MNVLVTGGAGYVGGFTARHLVAAGHAVTVLDDLSKGHPQASPAGSLQRGRVSDRGLVRELCAREAIEAVIHFAGSTALGESVRNPRAYYRNNVLGTFELLDTLLEAGVTRIVFSSTCAVYSEAAEMPLTESSPIAPLSPYAFTKHAIERMLADFARADGLRYAALRYFNAAGAAPDGSHGEHHDPETHLIPIVLRAALGLGPELEIFGEDYPTPDGTCVRDYVHVEDLARAHEVALQRLADPRAPDESVYNLGTGTGSSVMEVIRCAERVAGRRVPHRVGPRRPGDSPSLVAAAGRAREELGWAPRFAELEGIVETAWAWHRTHPDGYAA